MNRKKQGDIGVAMAISYFTSNGYAVSIPIGDSSRYDLIIDMNNILQRVQVKTTGYKSVGSTYQVQLSTQGGNQSWNYISKYILKEEVDIVFVYCLNGTMYILPVDVVLGRRSLQLKSSLDTYMGVLGNGEPKAL